VRQIMKMTLTRTSDNYVVHELLTAEDTATPCDPSPINSASSIAEPNMLHCNEVAGHDIRASPDGLWRAIAQGNGKISKIVVDAGPIHHRGNILL
jgi:ribonuclease Z